MSTKYNFNLGPLKKREVINIAKKYGGGTGSVDSVFGRSGSVTAQSGDYTAAQVGLGNVDNTSDADKPVSTAAQTALNLKQDALGFTAEDSANKATDFATVNDTLYPTVAATKGELDLKLNLTGGTITGNADVVGTLSVGSINIEQTVNAQTGTTYTLVAADNRRLITFNNNSNITVTLPQQSTLTTVAGFTCKFLNIGVGTVTFIKEGSETLIGNTLAATNAGGAIERPSTTSWEIFGGTTVVNNSGLGPVILSVTTNNTKVVSIIQANCTLLGFSQRCFSLGTAGTYDIQLNGVDIAGLTGIVPATAGSVESVTTATNLVAGDVISIVADGTLATVHDLLLVPNFTETF